MELELLKQKIVSANEAYRKGDAIMSDEEYDGLLDELSLKTDGKDDLLQKIGFEVSDEDNRKEQLPIPMYSMNKVKSLEEIQKWAELKFIEAETKVVITPKYDGLSLCAYEKDQKAWTRGNGVIGQRSDIHYQKLMQNLYEHIQPVDAYSFGEVIMKKSTFQKKWKATYKNSRNMGAGALNSKEAGEELVDFDFLRFGLANADGSELDKVDQLEILNKDLNMVSVPFKLVTLKELTDELLENCYQDWGVDYEIDGLIIEVNDATLRKGFGREKNGNPIYARAWKGFQEEAKATFIETIRYQVSKNGLLKPVAKVKPIELDGVTVSNVTLNNANYIEERGIGEGAEVLMIRSGQVIPKVIQVLTPAEVNLPEICSSCGTKAKWNENHVELVCNNSECEGQKLQKIIAFFSILEVENLAEGIIVQLIENGHDTVEKILKLTKEDFLALDKFQERKAEVIYGAIQDKIKEIPLSKIQHASGCFEGLGTKKLKLLEHFENRHQKPTLEEIVAIDGFSEKSAQSYLAGWDEFWKFIEPLPITIQAYQKQTSDSDLLSDIAVCFSGIRRKDLEEIIEKNGGKVAGTVSKKTSHLVMKEKGTGSSKEKKAEKLEISIMEIGEFEGLIREKIGSF